LRLGIEVFFFAGSRTEHYGQAAADLHIVQPALTRQIKQLEEELGVQLFERLPRGVRLTPAGKVLSRNRGALAGVLIDWFIARGRRRVERLGLLELLRGWCHL